VSTAAESYLKDGNPCESDVVEGDGALKRVATGRFARSVVSVPVDTVAGRHAVRRVAA